MRPHKMKYEEPEFARVEADGRMVCPCGVRFGVGFIPCDRDGNEQWKHRAIVRCILSGHIITADAVVIGRREVTA